MQDIVKKAANGRQWNIVSAQTGEILEGGFFSKQAVMEIRDIGEKEKGMRCADCGARGESTGHMTCQYPQNHD